MMDEEEKVESSDSSDGNKNEPYGTSAEADVDTPSTSVKGEEKQKKYYSEDDEEEEEFPVIIREDFDFNQWSWNRFRHPNDFITDDQLVNLELEPIVNSPSRLKPLTDFELQEPLFPFRFQTYVDQKIDQIDERRNKPGISSAPRLLDDSALEVEFIGLYGPMDTESQHFKKLFFRYKQQRMEDLEDQMKSCCSSESHRAYQPTPITTDSSYMTLLEEQKKSMENNLMEWFLLPKPKVSPAEDIKVVPEKELEKIKKPIMTILPQKYGQREEPQIDGERKPLNGEQEEPQKHGQREDSSNSSQMNLLLFDPRFNLSEYILDDDDATMFKSRRILSPPLRRKFAKLLDKYPRGIILEKFMSVFKEEHGYFPQYLSFYNYPSFEEMAKAYPDVFWIQRSPLKSKEYLLFPAYLEDLICSPTEILSKVWIKIQILLSENNYILPLDTIPEKLVKAFGPFMNPTDWCYKDTSVVYNFCLKRWPTDEWMGIESDLDYPRNLVLVQKHSKFPKTLEYYERNEESLREQKRRCEEQCKKAINDIPEQYASLYEEVNLKANEIEPGTLMECYRCQILNPGNFYVNIWDCNKCEVEALMKKIQLYYMGLYFSSEEDKYATPNRHQLIPGLFVVIKKKSNDEWYRARIVEKIGDDNIHAFLIDYGDNLQVHRSNVRFLLREFLQDVSAQAVKCCVKLQSSQQSSTIPVTLDGQCWPGRAGINMREIVGNNHLAISFEEKSVIEGVPIWHVFVHVLKKGSSQISVHHVEQQVFKMFAGLEI